MFFGKIRKRLRKKVTSEELQNELFAMGSVQQKQGEMLSRIVAMQQKQGEMLSRIALIQQKLLERADRGFEGLEKNDMAMLESLDKWGTRLGDLIEGLRVSAPQKNDAASEAQVKREWFGEDEE